MSYLPTHDFRASREFQVSSASGACFFLVSWFCRSYCSVFLLRLCLTYEYIITQIFLLSIAKNKKTANCSIAQLSAVILYYLDKVSTNQFHLYSKSIFLATELSTTHMNVLPQFRISSSPLRYSRWSVSVLEPRDQFTTLRLPFVM